MRFYYTFQTERNDVDCFDISRVWMWMWCQWIKKKIEIYVLKYQEFEQIEINISKIDDVIKINSVDTQ